MNETVYIKADGRCWACSSPADVVSAIDEIVDVLNKFLWRVEDAQGNTMIADGAGWYTIDDTQYDEFVEFSFDDV